MGNSIDTYLVWIYIVNSILLINHEVDSAYWKEWRLFATLSEKMFGYKNDTDGIKFFLIIHFPIWFMLLYGLVAVSKSCMSGYIISIIVSIIGMGALGIHSYFLKKGHKEFKTPISIAILVAAAFVSLIQLVVTIRIVVLN